jgi:hypothetical protein
MRSCFADGIAFICFFPEADGVAFSATILRNTIEASERGGLLFSCSFGPAHNRLRIVAADNILRGNKQFGISFLTAVPLAEKVPQDSLLTALVAGNEISASPVGVLVQGAAGEAHHNVCRVTIDRNRIASCSRNAVRLVGAMGGDEVPTRDNTLHAEVSRNRITGSTPAVIVQGAGGTAKSDPRQNAVRARLTDNVIDAPSAQAIVVSNGRADNRVEVTEGSQTMTRADGDLL